MRVFRNSHIFTVVWPIWITWVVNISVRVGIENTTETKTVVTSEQRQYGVIIYYTRNIENIYICLFIYIVIATSFRRKDNGNVFFINNPILVCRSH